ncbi:cupin domain-containing protein [Maribacter sp. 2307ULW6-5]|uniref:cupin domain-containing protein n=1 Tax=Maribacter sp. 2307ULW6-5 TaxID=3386275 RepID=UPI0039BC2C84
MGFYLSTLPSKEIMPGYHGKLVHTETMTLVCWEVEQGAVVPEHHHPHEQIMHVMEGEFEFTLNGITQVYRQGAVVPIAAHLPHSGKALTPCRLMDVFSPPRTEYQ